MGMKSEIDAALEAHAAWRRHFRNYLHGKASFDIEEAGANDHCNFGHWLAREGYRLMPDELHLAIREAHDAFHQVAAEIIHKIREKRFADAHADVAAGGALDAASKRLADLLRKASLREPQAAGARPAGQAPAAATPQAPPPPDAETGG